MQFEQFIKHRLAKFQNCKGKVVVKIRQKVRCSANNTMKANSKIAKFKRQKI